jgi:hypothetical protein
MGDIMEQKKPIDLKAELTNQVQPWIEYLIENRNNPNKVNSCLDVASENISSLESLVSLAEGYIKDFKTLKGIVFSNEKARVRKELHRQIEEDKNRAIKDFKEERCLSDD